LGDTDVSEELAATFRVEVCGFRNKLGYMGILQGRWSCDPKGEGLRKKPSPNQWEEMDKSGSYRGHTCLLSQVGNGIMKRTDLSRDPVLFSGGKWTCVKNGGKMTI
jgi:hypothetical protein